MKITKSIDTILIKLQKFAYANWKPTQLNVISIRNLCLIQQNNMKAKLYADFKTPITVSFSEHTTPILLPSSTIRKLMKKISRICLKTLSIKRISISSISTDMWTVFPIRYRKIGCFEIAVHISAKPDNYTVSSQTQSYTETHCTSIHSHLTQLIKITRWKAYHFLAVIT